MTATRSHSRLDVFLEAGRRFLQQKRADAQEAIARYKVYSATKAELSSLSDRSLRDLGIPRSSIRRLALEAAYGL
ncbi:DUF1127 domain-containing protein [Pararhodobacter oceanensis]|uniref:YjiS-like domain-containing protein n=2 Tax=Pararhodobacter oceanensis TaxID=2172121 RepID=A0A2T8HXJ5_9RHOB|nr:DUF1127 domain-containing protein [Pararhodobacter oceanensis]PVH30155.1 hypothetical protein DDE20_00885 [Pararhodobacter oceanensis]